MSDEHQNHEQQHHHEGGEHQNHHAEAPAPQAEPEKPQVQAEEEKPEPKQKARKSAPARRATGQELSWAEVESIIQFNRIFESSSEINRTKVLQVFGLDPKDNAVSLAQAIKPPSGGKVWAYETYVKIARKIQNGSLGFLDGIQIVQEFTNSTPDEIKLFDNVVEAFGGESQYRRNVAVTDYIQGVMGSINPANVDVALFDWIDGLLAVWPGESA